MPAKSPTTRSARAKARELALKRRNTRQENRNRLLEGIAGGLSYERVAFLNNLSVATVRREVDRALMAQREGSAKRYVAMQIARLNRAMVAVFEALDEGDLGAVPAMATLLPQFDRYHGLAGLAEARDALDAALLAAPAPRRALRQSAPKALELQTPATEIHAAPSSSSTAATTPPTS